MGALARRGVHSNWSWQKAHAVETAFFCNPSADPDVWMQGPNVQRQCNAIQHEDGADPWLCLSGGTDWQGFQGGYRQISEDGVRAKWVTFKVRIDTTALSGAFFTLSGSRHTWGLSEPIFLFTYRGDDSTQYRRSFTVETSPFSQNGFVHKMCPDDAVVADRPYDVALRFDWDRSVVSVYINGKQYVNRVPFSSAVPVRYAAIYNWRSEARTAFSDLTIGNHCPYQLEDAEEANQLGGFKFKCPQRSANFGPVVRRARSSSPFSFGNLGRRAYVMSAAVVLCAIGLQLVWVY